MRVKAARVGKSQPKGVKPKRKYTRRGAGASTRISSPHRPTDATGFSPTQHGVPNMPAQLYWLVPYTGGHGPVDPGWGVGHPGGGRPDNSLPGWSGPVDPGYGRPSWGGPVDPGYGQGHPRPPHIGNWVPGSWGGRPDNTLPGGPVDPGWGVGRPPVDPGWGQGHPRPPHGGNLPAYPIYRPDNSLPPGASPKLGLWVVAYLAGKGFVWTPVAPALPEQGLPAPPEGGQELPEVPPEGGEHPPEAETKPA